jgi:putative peptide zinc metalloprotease protein
MAVTAPKPTPRPRRRARAATAPEELPRLAEGIELLGEFEDSGFEEAPHLARRANGEMIQLTRLLHLVAEAADGGRTSEEMSDEVAERLGRGVSADNVRFLVERKLRPLGVMAAADGTSPEVKKSDPLLALKFRTALVPDTATRALTTVFRPLFLPPIVVAVVCAFAAAIGWLFFVHGVGQSLRGLIYNPAYLLILFGGIAVGTAFHEIGHATALRYGGGRPGVMGAGIYIVWPAFYTDVTDAYRLSRVGRLRTDLGGIYFNMIVAIIVVAINLVTGFEVILLLAVAQTFAITQQLLPLLRLDGYYILSDITGVPDMLNRIKPVLRSAVPGRDPETKVTELKPWVRRVVTSYVLILVPLLALLFIVMLLHAPRAMATAYDSFGLQLDRIDRASGAVGVGGSVLQLVMLVLPVLGMVLTSGRVGRRAAAGTWSMTEERPIARSGIGLAAVAAVALAAFTWWPNGEYRPIQPGERGTLEAAVRSFAEVPTGRPALTPERLKQLGGAPSERDVRAGRVKRTPAAAGASIEQDTKPAEERTKGERESEAPTRSTSTGSSESTTSTGPATPSGATTRQPTPTDDTSPPPEDQTTPPATGTTAPAPEDTAQQDGDGSAELDPNTETSP